MSTKRNRQGLNRSFVRKLKKATDKYEAKKQQEECDRLMQEVGPLLDNNFYLSDTPSAGSSSPTLRPDDASFAPEDSLSELISLGARSDRTSAASSILASLHDPSYVEEASFEVQRPKRIKLDANCPPIDWRETVIEIYTFYNEIEVVNGRSEQETVLNELNAIKAKPKSVQSQLEVFYVTRKYENLLESVPRGLKQVKRAVLLLTGVKFEQVPKGKKYFLLVTTGSDVYRSKLVKYSQEVQFDDDFLLTVSRNFQIKVELFAFGWQKYSWYPKWSQKYEIKPVSQFELGFDDLLKPKKGFRLAIQNFEDYRTKCGHLWYYHQEQKAWIKYWCVLSNQEFVLYNCKEKTKILKVFDLKWVTYSRVEDGTFIFNVINRLNKLTKHEFKGVNVNSLKLWSRDLNFVIDLLIEWNASFLSNW